jgi:L-serine deaminase
MANDKGTIVWGSWLALFWLAVVAVLAIMDKTETALVAGIPAVVFAILSLHER